MWNIETATRLARTLRLRGSLETQYDAAEVELYGQDDNEAPFLQYDPASSQEDLGENTPGF